MPPQTGKERFLGGRRTGNLERDAVTRIGDIVRGDSAGSFASFMDPEINREDTEQKSKEQAADDFAASLIQAAAADFKDMNRFKAGNDAKIAILSLSWNLFGIRILDHFGGTAISLPELFWDTGYSHPNLELRILTLNARASPSPSTQKMLDEFASHRRRPDAVAPLYERAPAQLLFPLPDDGTAGPSLTDKAVP